MLRLAAMVMNIVEGRQFALLIAELHYSSPYTRRKG